MRREYVPTGAWRHNPMSNVPGGSIVTVSIDETYLVHYNNIKYPSKYVQTILDRTDRNITAVWIDNELIWQKQ